MGGDAGAVEVPGTTARCAWGGVIHHATAALDLPTRPWQPAAKKGAGNQLPAKGACCAAARAGKKAGKPASEEGAAAWRRRRC